MHVCSFIIRCACVFRIQLEGKSGQAGPILAPLDKDEYVRKAGSKGTGIQSNYDDYYDDEPQQRGLAAGLTASDLKPLLKMATCKDLQNMLDLVQVRSAPARQKLSGTFPGDGGCCRDQTGK